MKFLSTKIRLQFVEVIVLILAIIWAGFLVFSMVKKDLKKEQQQNTKIETKEPCELISEESRCSDECLRLEEASKEVDGNKKAISILKENCLWLLGTEHEDFDGDKKKEILMVTSGAGCGSCHVKNTYIIKNEEIIFEKVVNEPEVRLADKYTGFEIKEALNKDNSPATCCPDKYIVYSYRLQKGGKGLNTFYKFAERVEPYFKCPEDYASDQEHKDALIKYLRDPQIKDMTVDEVFKKRQADLISHGCTQTLLNMSRIGTDDKIIKFLNKEYGPYVTEFDNKTKVYSVYYPLKDQKTGEADEEIIFNFYFQNVWANEPFSSEVLANQINENTSKNIYFKFEAPDPINKEPAFFFVSHFIYPEENYSYLHFMKVASIGKDVYSIMFSRKLQSQAKQLQESFADILANNMNGEAIDYLGPNESWLDLFEKDNKLVPAK